VLDDRQSPFCCPQNSAVAASGLHQLQVQLLLYSSVVPNGWRHAQQYLAFSSDFGGMHSDIMDSAVLVLGREGTLLVLASTALA